MSRGPAPQRPAPLPQSPQPEPTDSSGAPRTGATPGFWNQGTASNLASLALLALGLAPALVPVESAPGWLLEAGPWAAAAGLFGFAGGITNWLAVKMLFDRVPGLYGSGVIPNRFREIRQTIKDLIMAHFFDEAHLRRFFAEHGQRLAGGAAVQEELRDLLARDEADRAITGQLDRLQHGPLGLVLRLAGTDILKAMVRHFLEGLVAGLAPALEARLRERAVDIPALRAQVDRLLAAKLEELTPEVVKGMMEQVMRQHLGWLIVWGNVFGAAIGLLSRAAAVPWGVPGRP